MIKHEQKISDAIEAIPALYGQPERKEKAIKAVKQVFSFWTNNINEIFLVDSSLDLETRIEKLREIIEKIGRLLCDYPHGMKWLKVKTAKGESDRSRKCTIKIFKGEQHPKGDPPETGESTFLAAASIIYFDAEDEGWLPAFVVREGLSKNKQNSKYRSQQYDRVPISAPSWPGKEEYLANLIALLPSRDKIEQELKERNARAEKQKIEIEARLSAQKVEREERKRLEAQKATEAKQKKDARLAKMEQIHNVDVARSHTIEIKENGYNRWKRCEEKFKNVSLYYSGQRVYIIEENGKETISTRANVRIVSNGGHS